MIRRQADCKAGQGHHAFQNTARLLVPVPFLFFPFCSFFFSLPQNKNDTWHRLCEIQVNSYYYMLLNYIQCFYTKTANDHTLEILNSKQNKLSQPWQQRLLQEQWWLKSRWLRGAQQSQALAVWPERKERERRNIVRTQWSRENQSCKFQWHKWCGVGRASHVVYFENPSTMAASWPVTKLWRQQTASHTVQL